MSGELKSGGTKPTQDLQDSIPMFYHLSSKDYWGQLSVIDSITNSLIFQTVYEIRKMLIKIQLNVIELLYIEWPFASIEYLNTFFFIIVVRCEG